MSKKIHQKFLDLALSDSPKLHKALSVVGPLIFRPRNKLPLATHLCRSVVGQQLSTKAADSIWNKLVALSDNQNLIEFIRSSEMDFLRTSGLSTAKARTLHEISNAFASNLIVEKDFLELDHLERSKKIIQIWGIGQWTADMLNIFYFSEPDIWPLGDLAVQNTFKELTEDAGASEKFRPYRSYLAMYMWEYRDSYSGRPI